nr:transcription factor sox-3-like [Dermacentor andersoni]
MSPMSMKARQRGSGDDGMLKKERSRCNDKGDVDPGGSQRSSSASLQQTTNRTRLRSIPRLLSQPAAEAATAASAVASDTTVAGASLSSEVQHSYQLRSCIQRPPNAFMLVAHEKMRSVAAEKPNENNQRVSSHLGKLWRSLSAADKEPYQHKPSAAAAVHRRKHPDYLYNTREAQRCKMQARRAKAIASELKRGTSGNQEQQPRISTAVAQDRGSPEFLQQQHPLPPPQSNENRATSAARGSGSGISQRMPLPNPKAFVTVTASAGSAARPCNVPCFPGPLPPSVRGANRENAVPTAQLTVASALKQAKMPYARTVLDNQHPPRSSTTKTTTRLRARRRSNRADSWGP